MFLVFELAGCGFTSAAPQKTPNGPGNLGFAPSSIAFGDVAVGSSATQTFTVSNPGSAAINVTQATFSDASFGAPNLALPMSVPAGQSVSVQIQFSPKAAGAKNATLSIASDASNSTFSVSLTGTGVQGQLSANPSSANFGSVQVGASASKTITLTNSGTNSITISNATVSGAGFSISGFSLPTNLNAGASAPLTLSFSPKAAGSASGSVQITSNASNSALTIALAGAAVQAQMSVTPSSVSFGSTAVGSSLSQTISISNAGSADLAVTQAAVSGTGFSTTGLTLPLTISSGNSATFTAQFAPASAGNFTGSITLTSNAPNSPLTISLSGTGATSAPALSANPSTVSFGDIVAGQTSSQNVTLTNTGNANVTISQVGVTGTGFSVTGASPNQILSAGQSVTLAVTFAPTTTGSFSGGVTITSTATNSPTSVVLSGGSHAVSLSWTASISSVVGYFIYRGTTSGGPYTKLNSTPVGGTAYTDTAISSGQTYFYVVTAVDSNGVESVFSNEATAPIPTP